MSNLKRYHKKIIRYVLLNPQLSFFAFFLFVASYAISDRSLIILYGFLFPWLAIIVLFLNLPFFRLLFGGINMQEANKKNHVLEHGTIYFLRQKYGKKHKIGGRALSYGFRVYGINSSEDIKESFSILQENLDNGRNGIVLSKYCGSNVPILQGASLVILTVSLTIMIAFELSMEMRLAVLLLNLMSYLLFRYPLGNYFQKRLTMSFDFSNARIISITKTNKDGFFEENPVYLVKTKIE